MAPAEGPPQYKYSFQQNYAYPERQQSYRLQQIYFVSPYTHRDFYSSRKAKEATDKRVEADILSQIQSKCNEAKHKRQAYLSESKRNSAVAESYEFYLNKAERVDMTVCGHLRQHKATIDLYE